MGDVLLAARAAPPLAAVRRPAVVGCVVIALPIARAWAFSSTLATAGVAEESRLPPLRRLRLDPYVIPVAGPSQLSACPGGVACMDVRLQAARLVLGPGLSPFSSDDRPGLSQYFRLQFLQFAQQVIVEFVVVVVKLGLQRLLPEHRRHLRRRHGVQLGDATLLDL